jgi:hypothetical protein
LPVRNPIVVVKILKILLQSLLFVVVVLLVNVWTTIIVYREQDNNDVTRKSEKCRVCQNKRGPIKTSRA